ncbi:MAG: hypothetical protein Ct9H90mP5_11520 [Acidimicrobiaceae bacterium]|nr:MAG: hypothetical protein Ct9H90mP5_11520 [Acidimicrobiaceae bacterium]
MGEEGVILEDCITDRLLGARVPTSSPKIERLPSVGNSKPAIILSVVVFPHPLGPSKEKNSPSSMVKSTLSTAVTSPNFLVFLLIQLQQSFSPLRNRTFL